MVRKLWDTLIRFLKAGTTPEKLALTCALGAIVGTLPIWGITTALCFVIAPVFRVNIVILQLVNYVLYPVQLLLILPFVKVGTYVFNINPLPYTPDELISLFQSNFWQTIEQVGFALSLGVGVWALASVGIYLAVYSVTLSFFRKWLKEHVQTNEV